MPLLLVGAGALLLSGCGGADQHAVLTQAADGLAKVRSGNMDLRMTVSGGDGAADGQVGFEERGPFSLPAAGNLPVARTEVIHIVGGKQDTTTFISTGKNAYVSMAGHTYSLPDARVQQLRSASTNAGGGNGMGSLRVDRWARDASTGSGATVDGVGTDRTTGSLDVRQFLNDLMQLSRSLGETASVPQVTDADARDLARAVRSSHFELISGRDDHLPRKLTAVVDFAAPSGGSGALARYSSTRLELDLTLTSVNQPVTVADPPGAQPFTALCVQQPDVAACKPAQS
jgi:hypothetical protein